MCCTQAGNNAAKHGEATFGQIILAVLLASAIALIAIFVFSKWGEKIFSTIEVAGAVGAFGGFVGGLAMMFNSLLDHKSQTMKAKGINNITTAQLMYIVPRFFLAAMSGLILVTLTMPENITSPPGIKVFSLGFLAGYSVLIIDLMVKGAEKLCQKWTT